METKNLLIIFVKNPELGKVKTRLAKTTGNQKALEIYKELLLRTLIITKPLECDKAVFYSNYIDDYDIWDSKTYKKYVQEGKDLGEKMKNAFELMFSKGYENIIIIGSDCFQLTTDNLENSFANLAKRDVVIGPAQDGGYYLLGMKRLHSRLFENKEWSTENVFLDTLLDVEKENLSYFLSETLSDVDHEEDLKYMA